MSKLSMLQISCDSHCSLDSPQHNRYASSVFLDDQCHQNTAIKAIRQTCIFLAHIRCSQKGSQTPKQGTQLIEMRLDSLRIQCLMELLDPSHQHHGNVRYWQLIRMLGLMTALPLLGLLDLGAFQKWVISLFPKHHIYKVPGSVKGPKTMSLLKMQVIPNRTSLFGANVLSKRYIYHECLYYALRRNRQ